MKFLILSVLLLSFHSYGQDIIKSGDIFNANSMEINLDGVELWDIKRSERAQAEAAFENKCYEEIPDRMRIHFVKLEQAHYFFKASDITTEYKVTRNKVRGRGTQLRCRANYQATEFANFVFELDYSKIFQDRVNGTFKLCQDLIAEIDRKSVEQGVFVRRVYYIYGTKRGAVFFPECQTLAVRLAPRD